MKKYLKGLFLFVCALNTAGTALMAVEKSGYNCEEHNKNPVNDELKYQLKRKGQDFGWIVGKLLQDSIKNTNLFQIDQYVFLKSKKYLNQTNHEKRNTLLNNYFNSFRRCTTPLREFRFTPWSRKITDLENSIKKDIEAISNSYGGPFVLDTSDLTATNVFGNNLSFDNKIDKDEALLRIKESFEVHIPKQIIVDSFENTDQFNILNSLDSIDKYLEEYIDNCNKFMEKIESNEVITDLTMQTAIDQFTLIFTGNIEHELYPELYNFVKVNLAETTKSILIKFVEKEIKRTTEAKGLIHDKIKKFLEESKEYVFGIDELID